MNARVTTNRERMAGVDAIAGGYLRRRIVGRRCLIHGPRP